MTVSIPVLAVNRFEINPEKSVGFPRPPGERRDP
jgi:hypothetical protein